MGVILLTITGIIIFYSVLWSAATEKCETLYIKDSQLEYFARPEGETKTKSKTTEKKYIKHKNKLEHYSLEGKAYNCDTVKFHHFGLCSLYSFDTKK